MNSAVIDLVKGVLDVAYEGRDIPRFYVLETVARCPYFAYCSVLHLKETLGQRDVVELIRKHYAEADNELHHLLIMDALTKPSPIDDLLARSLSMVTYWYSVLVYLMAPRVAYHLSELIEQHAYDTYDDFLHRKEASLKASPVPDIAKEYYTSDFFRTSSKRAVRLDSLYDVFVNVRDDEKEHWTTLCSLVQYEQLPADTFCCEPTRPAAED